MWESVLVAEPQCIRTPFLSDSHDGPDPGAGQVKSRRTWSHSAPIPRSQGPTGPPGSGPQFSFHLHLTKNNTANKS